MPVPPSDQDPVDYCWPNLVFPGLGRSIARQDDGAYFSFPEERLCSLDEARQWVREVYAAASE
jgi:hypothetical protein